MARRRDQQALDADNDNTPKVTGDETTLVVDGWNFRKNASRIPEAGCPTISREGAVEEERRRHSLSVGEEDFNP
jgi:hypothetical protein